MVSNDIVSSNEEIPAKPIGEQVNYTYRFSIKYYKHAFSSAHPCKYALCPKFNMEKSMENKKISGGTVKRSR